MVLFDFLCKGDLLSVVPIAANQARQPDDVVMCHMCLFALKIFDDLVRCIR